MLRFSNPRISVVVSRGFLALAMSCLALSGCWSDSGRTTKSSTPGFGQYRNNTIGVSVLSPEGWSSNVGINGVYTLTSPDGGRSQIYAMSSDLGSGRGPGLEDFRKYRLSQLAEDAKNSREFKSKVSNTTLAGRPAYEIQYSFIPEKENKRMYVTQIFTVSKGRVYQLQLYTFAPENADLQKTFRTMQSSYRILK